MGDSVTVAEVEELAPGEGMAVAVDGETIALFNVDGEFHAIGNRCTHVGGSLGNGRLSGTVVSCPLHGAKFDVTTGEVVSSPAYEPVPHYAVDIVGDEVRVELSGR